MCQSFPTKTSVHCCLEPLGSPRAVYSSVQSLLVLLVTVHFGSGKSSAAPAWLSKGAPQLQPGRLSPCSVAHAWHSWLPRQAACLASTGSLSVSKPAFVSQVCNSAAPGVSLAGSELFRCLFSSCPFRGSAVKWFREGGSSLKGRCSPLCPPPFSLNCRHLRKGRLGCLNFTESENQLGWKVPLRLSNPTYGQTPPYKVDKAPRWWLHHLPVQLIPMFNHPFCEEISPPSVSVCSVMGLYYHIFVVSVFICN